ncbi:hypothetical protein KCU65_g5613, partial [Aureobasidium melanogenum]
MLSIPSLNDSSKAHDGKTLRSKVSEQSIELSILTDDDNQGLISSKTEKHWTPLTQKAYFLVPTILASGALIAVLQVYLERSNRDTGILFAAKIDSLPLRETFSYLYMPTIVSLVLSFIWTWIDLDIKRLQPYVQLSRKHGALGNDSILLHYPFDFVALVPFAAIRRKHWPTFLASAAVVVIFWGLTPLPSSIFATKTIQKAFRVATITSEAYLSLQDQKETLTGAYAQSSYNIAWLNESLPPFMNRQGMLAPFTLADGNEKLETSETWTAPTHYYSVDINCEVPTTDDHGYIVSSWGCHYSLANMNVPYETKDDQYSLLYVGYWYEESMDSYLGNGDCPDHANQTFLIRWGRGRKNLTISENSPYPLESSTLWCRPTYYQQEVNATVAPPSMSVMSILPTGPKRPLPVDLINITDFEWSLSEGYEVNNNRGEFLTSSWPDPQEQVHARFPELYWDIYLPTMASFALGAYQRPAADYLDPEVLKDSYQAAYRLLLSRKLADILMTDFKDGNQSSGTRDYSTQALTMVPTFVYVVEGLLGITVFAAFLILAIPPWRRTILTSEPANLAAMMSIVGNDTHMIQTMSDKDSATSQQLDNMYQQTAFALRNSPQGPTLCCLDSQVNVQPVRSSKPSGFILPIELSWYFGSSFLVLQCLVAAGLVYTYVSANLYNGLHLPSESLFINQILVKYTPMVVGAFFEPIFTWLTRTLCMLQPYDKLRKGSAKPSQAITVDYDSLPPQAVIFRTLKAKTFSLASVCCTMTLLANLLSLAFSNVLREHATLVSTPRNFTAEYIFPLSGGPSIPNSTYDQFYIAMSNLTAGTPLPAWTDDTFFYIPFGGLDSQNASAELYQAQTPAVTASLECYPMYQTRHGGNLTWDLPAGSPSCNTTSLWSFDSMPSQVPEAIEYVAFLSYGSSFYFNDFDCDLSVFAGWRRSSRHQNPQDPLNASWIGCQPQLSVELRDVMVDSQGHVQFSMPTTDVLDSQKLPFKPDAKSILDAFHLLLGTTNTPQRPFSSVTTYHNDSYPSDFFNYLMVKTLNSSTILDPLASPPSFNTTAPVFQTSYTRIFAILLGTHISEVLQKPNEAVVVAGFVVAPESRIFVSRPMFIIAITILGVYILFTAMLYVYRPWKMLPRMPTTIASQIAFFAASHALQDFATTSSMSEKERNSHIKGLRRRYGYGKFLGTDGKAHIGVEREPLVQAMTKEDLRSMQESKVE